MFSKVYLCVKNNTHNKFTCKEFNDFLEADKYFDDNYKNKVVSSTMIPVCRFIPTIIKRPVLQYKLSNLYTRVSII